MIVRRRMLFHRMAAVMGACALGALAPRRASAANKRIGILHPLSGPAEVLPSVASLFAGLRELGWEPGKTVNIEFGWGEGKADLLAARAAELAASGVDVLVGGAAPGFGAAVRATRSIPIVMAASSFDPSREKASPNVCGTSIFFTNMPEARLRLLKELAPSIKTVGIIFNPSNPQSDRLVAEFEAASRSLALATTRVPATSAAEFEASVSKARSAGIDALVGIQGPDIFRMRKEIAQAALAAKLPAVTGEEDFVDWGGLAKLAPSITLAWHRAAWYVDQILKGRQPDALGVEVPAKAELIVNRSTAKALGLTIPAGVIARADRLFN